MTLSLNSEPVSPTGSISSLGIINQLGRPNLDTLAVLIRETVQNSWDARLSDANPISFSVKGWILSEYQKKVLSGQIFSARPPAESLSMAQLSSCTPLHGLIIVDRGTTGLAGPTRADVVPENSPRNFISFLRDVGQTANQDLSGGTFGYGKASLYRASGMRTIVVHTRCRNSNGVLESRFIAAALGNRWADKKGRQYTGRHWWGRNISDIAEPVLNEHADSLADALGMGGFDGDETGSTILVLDPLFNDYAPEQQMEFDEVKRTPLQAINSMAEYILWYFWPKMLKSSTGHPAINFDLQWEDTYVNLPHPSQFPPLAGFVEAIERLKEYRDDEPVLRSIVTPIASERPRQHLGRLALQQFFVDQTHWFDTGDTDSPFKGMTHHTALMRQVELVVKYLEGKPVTNSSIGYSGVFITDAEVDSIFANAEPPTHDDWNSKSLTDNWHKRYVSVALRRITDKMTEFVQPPRTSSYGEPLSPLGAFATWLGESLMPVEIGTSANRTRQRPINTGIEGTPTDSSSAKTTLRNTSSAESDTGGNWYVASTESDRFTAISGSMGRQNDLPDAPKAPMPMPSIGSNTSGSDQQPLIGPSSVDIISDELVDYKGTAALRIAFNVKHGKNASGSTVMLKAQAVLDSETVESEPPIGGSSAQIVYWEAQHGQVFSDTESSIYIAAEDINEFWRVLVILPDDIMVNVDITARAESVR